MKNVQIWSLTLLFTCLSVSTVAVAQSRTQNPANRFPQKASPLTYSEGWPAVGDASGLLESSESVVDLVPFMGTGTDICMAIQAALNLYLSTVVTLDGRGVTGANITCTVPPFTGTGNNRSALTGRLLLGAATITTSVQWTMPNTFFWIEGIASANKSTKGTQIVASSSFACNLSQGNIQMTLPGSVTVCPVFFIGDTGSGDSFGSGIRSLGVDCLNLTGCSGAGSVNIQEGGGIDNVVFYNLVTNCVDFDASAVVGGTGVSNPFIRNVNCVFTNSTFNANAVGLYVNAIDGPAEISNTTVSVPNSQVHTPLIGECLYMDKGRAPNINYFHCEHATYGEIIGGTSDVVTDANIRGLTAGNTQLGVWLQNATNANVQNVNMASGASGFLGALKDQANGNPAPLTISSLTLGQYSMTSAGGTLITTATSGSCGGSSCTVPSIFGEEQLIGFSLSALGSSAQPGTIAWCNNCHPNSGAAACTSGGTGALAVWQGSNWFCK